MKKKLLILLAIASLAMNSVAIADEEDTAEELQKTIREQRQEQREEAAEKRAEIKEEIQARNEERKAEQKERVEEKIEKACERIQERIANQLGNVENAKNKHMAVYENMTSRISKFIDRLSGEGYDVSTIQADLAVLNEKIDKFSDDFLAQAAKLDETEDSACGKSEGEFKQTLVEAREMMKVVHADAAEIRNYMRDTMRVDIQKLREQKVEDREAEIETTVEDEN